MHKYFVLFAAALASAAFSAEAAKPDVTRIEARYTARYRCINENLDMDTTATGTVVYYLTPRSKGGVKVDYILNADGSAPTDRRIALLNGLWPMPTQPEPADSATTLRRDVAAELQGDFARTMRIIGAAMAPDVWTIECTYSPADAAPELRSIEQSIDMTVTGPVWRRVFDTDSTRCRFDVAIDSCKSSVVSSAEARSERKKRR